MSRGMRLSAKMPVTAIATIAITSEIGRRKANEIKDMMIAPVPKGYGDPVGR
jgi:hypothetical protein